MENWLQSLVYRSPQAAEYYGDYSTIMQRVKTNTLTFGNFLPLLYQFLTGTLEEDDKLVMVLRVNDVEVDTVRIEIMQDARYMGCLMRVWLENTHRPNAFESGYRRRNRPKTHVRAPTAAKFRI